MFKNTRIGTRLAVGFGFVALMQAGERDAAVGLVNGELRQVQRVYLTAIDTLIRHQTDLMVRAEQGVESFYARARGAMLVLSGLAVVLAVFLGLRTTRSISTPLIRAALAADRLAAGDLGARIETGADDETGRLMAAMQGMVEWLVGIIAEVRAAADSLGDLAERVAGTARPLAEASAEQAASVEQTRSAVSQMTATIKSNGPRT